MNKPNRFKLFIIFFLIAFWSLFNPKLGGKIMILFAKNRDTKLSERIDELYMGEDGQDYY